MMKDNNLKNPQDYVLNDWERWANKYFPVEEKINNWEKHLIWVLKDNR